MKKPIFLSLLLLFTISLFSQSVKTDIKITGLGNFYLGDDISQTTDNIEANATEQTKVYSLTGGSALSCTNMPFVNYLFDFCSLTFHNYGLALISYTKVFDKNNKGLTEFSKILSILENDYGKQPEKSATLLKNEEEMKFIWADEKGGLIILSRNYDKKSKENKIGVTAQRISKTVDSKDDKLLENTAKKTESTTGQLYYAFDGKEYKTLKGRDNYEQRIEEKYRKLFDQIKAEMSSDSDIREFERLVFINLELLRKVRGFNNQINFLANETIREKAKKSFPSVDFTQYVARNNEVCYLKGIYDLHEALLGIYEIYDKMLNEIDKSFKEYLKGEDSASISLSLPDRKDSKGLSHKELVSIATDSSDKVGSLLIDLMEFHQKE